MPFSDTARRPMRRAKFAYAADQEYDWMGFGKADNRGYDWMRIASILLGISLLVNLFTISTLYANNVLGVDVQQIEFSHERNEVASITYQPQPDRLHAVDGFEDDFIIDRGARFLSSTSSSNSVASHGSAGHTAHQHDALLYLFNALVIGAAIMQLNTRFPFLQQTVMLFVVGFTFSVIMQAFKLSDDFGVFGTSYEMWIDMDPHLLLFVLLPALLAGDAMTIDTFVAKKVYLQCLWLAGPGVLIGGFSCAIFLYYYLDWEFWLCLCAGAILCATDPVAVVALLKELGASPMLTVQIQGESLLNDGTAIVLYLISYALLRGETFEWTDVAEFLIKKALMAWALGLFIGYFFFCWIWSASDKLEHGSSMIQITLTFVCAYWSFIFVEGVLTLSGVLATVAASLVLANHMWQHVAFPESMHDVWHTFESLGNIVIFVLAGSITGKIVVNIDAIDYLHLLVIYVVLLVIRAVLIFGCRPILSYLSMVNQPVSWQDAAVMTWGGLRGAVGLALAISVRNDLAPDICDPSIRRIDQKDGERLLFYVSGVAFLTMVVNATTAPYVVTALGITSTPEARRQLLRMFHDQLVRWSIKGDSPEEVTEALQHMLDEALGEINHQQVDANGPKVELKSRRPSKEKNHDELKVLRSKSKIHSRSAFLDNPDPCQENKDLIAALDKEKKKTRELTRVMFSKTEARDDYDLALRQIIGGEHLQYDADGGEPYMATRLRGVSKDNPFGDVDGIKKLLEQYEEVDTGMAKVINKCFLELVSQNYWSQINNGSLRPGAESEILFSSVRISMSPYRPDLTDYSYIEQRVHLEDSENFNITDDEDDGVLEELGDETANDEQKKTKLGHILGAWQFNMLVMVAILLNSVQVICEEIFRGNCVEKCGSTCEKKAIDDHAMWIVLDGIFTVFFTVEFFLKFAWLKCSYFHSNWNKFDFFLVCVGIFGLIASIVTHGQEADLASQTRIIRVARVLRTLRFLRIFRLFAARMSADKHVSVALANRMKTISILTSFITAQLQAQVQLIEFFGGNGEIDEEEECEMGRCILQSQVQVYKALYVAAMTHHRMGEKMTRELEVYRKRKKITEGLRAWVATANTAGALSATETHAILHPLDHEIAHCVKVLSERADGLIDTRTLSNQKSIQNQPLHAAHMFPQSPQSQPAMTIGATEPPTTLPSAIPAHAEPPSRPAPLSAPSEGTPTNNGHSPLRALKEISTDTPKALAELPSTMATPTSDSLLENPPKPPKVLKPLKESSRKHSDGKVETTPLTSFSQTGSLGTNVTTLEVPMPPSVLS